MKTDQATNATPEAVCSTAGLGPLEAAAWRGPNWSHSADDWAYYDADDKPTTGSPEPLYALTREEVVAVNKLRARKVWQTRQSHLCKCDHYEYCRHCWPESFRPGGVWHGIGA